MRFYLLNILSEFIKALSKVKGEAPALEEVEEHSLEDMAYRQEAEHSCVFVGEPFSYWGDVIAALYIGDNISMGKHYPFWAPRSS